MCIVISLAEVRKDRLERFCNKFNWIYPIEEETLDGLQQSISEEDWNYYCKDWEAVVLSLSDSEGLTWR